MIHIPKNLAYNSGEKLFDRYNVFGVYKRLCLWSVDVRNRITQAHRSSNQRFH